MPEADSLRRAGRQGSTRINTDTRNDTSYESGKIRKKAKSLLFVSVM